VERKRPGDSRGRVSAELYRPTAWARCPIFKSGVSANAPNGNLDSLINEVNDLLSSRVLSPSQAASLISAAESVIAALS
jgi:hypothetical protein